MKKRGRRGFTLAELLIVVAILAVLVAIAIPVFGSSLKNAQETVCLANMTSAAHLFRYEELLEGKNGVPLDKETVERILVDLSLIHI